MNKSSKKFGIILSLIIGIILGGLGALFVLQYLATGLVMIQTFDPPAENLKIVVTPSPYRSHLAVEYNAPQGKRGIMTQMDMVLPGTYTFKGEINKGSPCVFTKNNKRTYTQTIYLRPFQATSIFFGVRCR